ncbi:MAG: hypothetical protein PHP74_04740, partial [Candidatus Gracilibacteria bacterium]|nr:hypothetical protein [Candidatus Gracilibacteria bacterium]
CQPIPGDAVLAYVAQNGSIYVHKRQCPIAMKLKSSDGDRIVSAEWAVHKKLSFAAEIEIIGLDTVGMINQITRIVSDEFSVNMNKLNFESKDGVFKGSMTVYVHDVDNLNRLCTKISKLKNIKSVTRVEHHNRLVALEEGVLMLGNKHSNTSCRFFAVLTAYLLPGFYFDSAPRRSSPTPKPPDIPGWSALDAGVFC